MLTVRQETFLLRARLMGAAFLIWLGRQDYEIHRVFRPLGHSQKLRMFKIVPDDFS